MNETFSNDKNNSYLYKSPLLEHNVRPMKDNISIATKRLREFVRRHGGVERPIAIKLGIDPRTFNNYCRDREPPTDVLQKIADVYGLDLTWFYQSERQPPKESNRVSMPPAPAFRGKPGEYASIGLYENRLGAGTPIMRERDISSGALKFRIDWLRSVTASPFDKIKALYVSNDSMEPVINDGDLVLVDMNDTRPSKKGIYAVRTQDGIMAKYVTIDHLNQKYILSSENPLYGPREMEAEDVEIIGRLLWRAGKI